MKTIYLLKADPDGTMRSIDTPFGAAVTSKEEAELYVKEGGVGYTHSYEELVVYDTKKEALENAFKRTIRF